MGDLALSPLRDEELGNKLGVELLLGVFHPFFVFLGGFFVCFLVLWVEAPARSGGGGLGGYFPVGGGEKGSLGGDGQLKPTMTNPAQGWSIQ